MEPSHSEQMYSRMIRRQGLVSQSAEAEKEQLCNKEWSMIIAKR